MRPSPKMKSISSALTAVLFLLVLAVAPALRAEPPADQVKDAASITLTTDLLDKMDKAIKALSADAAAKAELAAIGKESGQSSEAWAAAIADKCPKANAHFKDAGITPSDFTKGISAIMACAMSDEMAKSSDKTAAANAAFVTANKDKCEAIFGGFMALSMSAESTPAP